MKAKQTLIDIGIILAIPVLALLASYFWSSNSDTALLSIISPRGQEQEFGAKAKAALTTLKSITMDTSLFDDPVYQSLEEFHVDVMPATLGRSYPFTPPDTLRNQKPAKAK